VCWRCRDAGEEEEREHEWVMGRSSISRAALMVTGGARRRALSNTGRGAHEGHEGLKRALPPLDGTMWFATRRVRVRICSRGCWPARWGAGAGGAGLRMKPCAYMRTFAGRDGWRFSGAVWMHASGIVGLWQVSVVSAAHAT
jgi:hypothetical protein